MARKPPGVQWLGKPLTGVNPKFIGKIARALHDAGATKINVISTKRTPQTNTGVSNSNHLYGHAIDATAYIPGRGWVPLGTLLKDNAGQYGLRSGDQPGFYLGKPDPNHVDDGYNVNHGAPLKPDVPIDSTTGVDAGTTSAVNDTPGNAAPTIEPPTAAALPTDLPVPSINVQMPGTVRFAPHGLAALWQSVQQDDFVSPETQRLIQNAQLAAGG